MDAAPDFTLISGPPLIGFWLNMFLGGILTVQVYIYYLGFPNDAKLFKALVYTLYFLEAVQTILLCVDKFKVYAVNFGNPEMINIQETAWFAVPVLTAVTSAIVQCFFGFRIYTFSQSWILSGMVMIIALLQCSAGLAQGIMSFPLKMNEIALYMRTTTIIWFVASAVNDVLIAILLSIYLNRLKSGIDKTDATISRIIRMTVETGCLTAVWAILVVILFLLVDAPWFLTFSDSIGKVYANNLLVMFNRRLHIRHADPAEINNPSSHLSGDNPYRSNAGTGGVSGRFTSPGSPNFHYDAGSIGLTPTSAASMLSSKGAGAGSGVAVWGDNTNDIDGESIQMKSPRGL